MCKKVLIADDQAIMREKVKTALTSILDGHKFLETANGREAVDLAAQTNPDLIILDLSMPEMDGITAAKFLKQSMPNTPVILFTVHNLGKAPASEYGVDAIVSKLNGLGNLRKVVQSFLFPREKATVAYSTE
jgi:DNA-binding NarL/FixJ family response regulator